MQDRNSETKPRHSLGERLTRGAILGVLEMFSLQARMMSALFQGTVAFMKWIVKRKRQA